MGIRLVCPQGHKLHVKAFLAGKRAICPHCGEKVLVPLGSEAPASGESLPAGSPISLETTIDLADLPATLPGGVSAAAVTTAPAGAAPAIVPLPSAISPAPVTRQSVNPTAAPAALGIPPAAPSAHAAGDAIAESPDAVWYVRPKSGGQYGPAPGTMMRQWIGQSRVAGDSLVWREGWAQWRTASEVFVELGAGNSHSGVAARMPVGGLVSGVAASPSPVAAAPAGGVATASTVRYHARRRSTGRLVALIVVLGLLVISLAGVLVYVVNYRI